MRHAPRPAYRVASDASAAALAEFQHGAGRGTRDLVMLTLGTGVGGGIGLRAPFLTSERLPLVAPACLHNCFMAGGTERRPSALPS